MRFPARHRAAVGLLLPLLATLSAGPIGCADAGGDGGAASDLGAGPRDLVDPVVEDAAPGPDLPPGVCDVVLQAGCGDAAKPKCSIIYAMNMFQSTCVEWNGEGMDGDPCERTAGGSGHDDCAAGLFCTAFAVSPLAAGGTRYCRRLCHSDVDCRHDPHQRCLGLTDNVTLDGICVPTCAPFAGECEAGLSCADLEEDVDRLGQILLCHQPGTGQEGDACADDGECVADHVCVSRGAGSPTLCTPLCDANHACAGGGRCVPVPRLPNDAGYCL